MFLYRNTDQNDDKRRGSPLLLLQAVNGIACPINDSLEINDAIVQIKYSMGQSSISVWLEVVVQAFTIAF